MRAMWIASLLVLAAAAGCGGRSTGVTPSGPTPMKATSSGTVLVPFSIVVPRASSAAQRGPRYVSASTQSALVAVVPSGGSGGTSVTVNCTSTCSGQIAAPVGTDTFTMKLYDAQNGGGSLLSLGTITQQILIDQANQVKVTFNGVVTSFGVVLNPSTVSTGAASTVSVAVSAFDADHNAIVGPGSYADTTGAPLTVTLTDSDSSGATHLSQTTLSAPTTGITLSYNGATIPNPTISASANGIAPAQAALTLHAAGAVNEFSAGISANAGLSGITGGPDGNVWFTESNIDRIGRITPSGVVTEFSAGISAGAGPGTITTGPDGNLWFTEFGARIGRITPAGAVVEFTTGISGDPQRIAAGPDGNVWFTEGSKNLIGRITPSGTVTEFGNGITANAFPYGVVTGPDGNLWFTEYTNNRFARITPTGTVTEFGALASSGNVRPAWITAGPDGNLWSTLRLSVGVARVTPTGTSTLFTNLPQGVVIAAGPDGNLWQTDSQSDEIDRIQPNGAYIAFPAGNSTNLGLSSIAAGPDGNMWFIESSANRIGRISP